MRAARESTRNEKLGTFAPGDLVLAKIKGSPLWPAIVADPSTASEAQTKQRPRVRKNAVYYIRFLGVKAGTHAWLTAYKLAPLGRTEIQARIRERARKKNTNLTKGYRKALQHAARKEKETAAPVKVYKEDYGKEADDDEEEEDELSSDEEGVGTKSGKRQLHASPQ